LLSVGFCVLSPWGAIVTVLPAALRSWSCVTSCPFSHEAVGWDCGVGIGSCWEQQASSCRVNSCDVSRFRHTPCCAGTAYRVDNALAGEQVEVRLVEDAVQVWAADKLIRTHPARHDKGKEHGAFGVPKGRPRKLKAS